MRYNSPDINPRIDPSGNKHWTNEKGETHRDGDLPAIEWKNGTKEWWINGKLHRENGLPAVEFFDGHKVWYDENDDCCRYDDWTNNPS